MKLARPGTLCVLLGALFVFACLILSPPGTAMSAGDPGSPGAGLQSGGYSVSQTGCQILFPDLHTERIVQLYVITQDQQYVFLRESESGVSVNGNQADAEIFRTLVSQIEQLPVDALHPFQPQSKPILTLSIITSDGARHTARFYSGHESGALARITSGPEGATVYHQTDAWRLGTLMMACEGTRIQDERGNETPAN